MIFLDSNVPMYLVGADHPNKHAVRRVLERLIVADALHVAVMQRHDVRRILSFDAGFDQVEGVERVSD